MNIGVNYFYDASFDFGNNYIYRLAASYPDGESAISPATYFIYTSNPYFMEYSHDDGSAESFTVNESDNRYAVNYSFSEIDILKEIIWYEFSESLSDYNPKYLFILQQNDDGTMSYVLEDEVINTTNATGWHRKEFAVECDESDEDCIHIDEEIQLTGNMWFGIRTFSSSNSIGIDGSSSTGNSFYNNHSEH
jgi:hypothetical protein